MLVCSIGEAVRGVKLLNIEYLFVNRGVICKVVVNRTSGCEAV